MTGNKFLEYLLLLFFCSIPVWAQPPGDATLVFYDECAGTNGTNLTSHTPDTGSGWVQAENTSTTFWGIKNNTCQMQASQSNVRVLYSVNPSSSTADGAVATYIKQYPTGAAWDSLEVGAFLRYQDSDNYYGCEINHNNDGSDYLDVRVFKKVSGTVTTLASATYETVAENDFICEVEGSTITLYQSDWRELFTWVSLVTAEDSDITVAGSMGIWQGNVRRTDGDTTLAWRLDDIGVFKYEVAAPTPIIVAPEGGDYTTIEAAYAAASCGDVIQVREGTYTLTSAALDLDKTCTENTKLTIENYPDETPTLTCSNPETNFKRVEHNGAYHVWRGIEVTGCYDGIKPYAGNFEIYDSKIHHNLYQGILIAVTDAELSNITIDGNEIYRNGYAANNDVTCINEEWNPTPPYESPKHCHGIYISDYECSGTDDITITGNFIYDHGGRGLAWNGEGCASKMANTLVQGNTFANNSHNIILWYNVEDAVINDNDFIASGFPETDDTSHGHFSIIGSPGNTITNNTFYSDITTYEQLQMLDSGSDVGMTVDGNIWGYRNTWWKWDNSWRDDFDTDFLSVTGFETNGCISYYTSFPCTP